ncbi:hypothetical protein BSL78_12023 [Apostichopus japonicus]|uniref:Uncharacterized protein n=1 Tax=Stichopus japonicus TaxID=307972 RepID=A0A2G8KST6_STIJA|nr:hypothetical protein BSL78_12023 [Apostichopus japonicus]
MQKINEGCDGPTQFPVLSYENPNKPIIYKNPECAVCNGLPARKQRCLNLSKNDAAAALNGIVGLNRGSIIEHTDIYGKLYMDSKEVQENKKDELHHVIINYNSDMTRTVIVNEDDRYIVPIVHECPYGAVFDPFQGQCRQIHCESGYVLEGNECVLDINIQGIVNSLTELASGVADGRNGTPMGHRFKLIITVNVSMDGRPVLEFLKNNSVLQRFVSFLNTTELISEESKENATSAFSPMRPRWLTVRRSTLPTTHRAMDSGIKSSQFQGSNQLNKLNFANAKKDIAVYIKLLTTTGFGWVFGYIAAISEITALWSLFLILNKLGFDASEFQKNNKSVNEERVSKSTTDDDDDDEVPEDDVIIAKFGENNKGFDLSELQENENSTKVGMVAKEVDEMADDDVGMTNIHKENTLDEVFL